MHTQTHKSRPHLPRLLTFPLALVPTSTHSTAACLALNRIFRGALRDGELEPLEGRVVEIRVDDLRLRLRFTLERCWLRPADERAHVDLTIEGDSYDFLLLASRREERRGAADEIRSQRQGALRAHGGQRGSEGVAFGLSCERPGTD